MNRCSYWRSYQLVDGQLIETDPVPDDLNPAWCPDRYRDYRALDGIARVLIAGIIYGIVLFVLLRAWIG